MWNPDHMALQAIVRTVALTQGEMKIDLRFDERCHTV